MTPLLDQRRIVDGWTSTAQATAVAPNSRCLSSNSAATRSRESFMRCPQSYPDAVMSAYALPNSSA